jgi:hypothetical protein
MAELNDDKTIHLIRIAAADLPKPDSDLRSRLRAADAAAWIDTEVGRVAAAVGSSAAAVVEGTASLEMLRRMKSRAVAMARENLHARDRMSALLVHRLVVASALLHHGVLISESTREVWDDRLLDLALDAPEPWQSLLRRAADVE